MLRTRIRKHEVGLRFRNGDFVRFLQPGTYWDFSALFGSERTRIEVRDRLSTRFEHELLDILIEDAELRKQLLVVDLTANQRALLWRDGILYSMLGPGRHAFWNGPRDLKLEMFDVDDFRAIRHPALQSMLEHPGSARFLDLVRVEPFQVALLFREGEQVGTLRAGLYVFWKGVGKIESRTVDLREQVADVSGQEIMTADKVTLRVNLLVTYQVTDVVKVTERAADYQHALYRDAQLALREAVGTRSIDQLLTDKESVGGEITATLRQRLNDMGLAIRSVGLRDIILPGEMKTILNQVIEAQKRAEANLIKRREETAAARSQANTARLLADNPILARMKELEIIQEILVNSKPTFVLGTGDLARQITNLI